MGSDCFVGLRFPRMAQILWNEMAGWLHNILTTLNAAELYTLKWLILWYMTFPSKLRLGELGGSQGNSGEAAVVPQVRKVATASRVGEQGRLPCSGLRAPRVAPPTGNWTGGRRRGRRDPWVARRLSACLGPRVMLGSRDRVPRRAPGMEPASPSACVSASSLSDE